ncbi:MAG: DUF5009 domain-containing protein [Eubacterium sp.]|nr:DUF5009 domain-containing protein [Eubacterium sp.]
MEKIESKSNRIKSIDALRGFAMFWYLGGIAVVEAFANLLPNKRLGAFIIKEMGHTDWHGLSYIDMNFPLFVFVSGMSFPMSYRKFQKLEYSKGQMYLQILKRIVILSLIGLIYNGLFSLNISTLRIFSPLSRIGISVGLASIIYINTKNIKERAVWFFGIVISYVFVLKLFIAPDYLGMDNLSVDGNIVGYVDRLFFMNHLYTPTFDPEGIISTIAATSTALLGMIITDVIMLDKEKFSDKKKLRIMFIAAISLLIIGYLLHFVIVFNKRLWTSSVICFAGGYAILVFELIYFIMDVKGKSRILEFLIALGRNSIAGYVGYIFIDFTKTRDMIFGGIVGRMPEVLTPLINEIGLFLIWIGIMWFMHKKKIYINP